MIFNVLSEESRKTAEKVLEIYGSFSEARKAGTQDGLILRIPANPPHAREDRAKESAS